MNYKIVAIAGTLIGAAAGSVAGYFYAERKLTSKFDAILDQEVADIKEHYKKLYKVDEYSSPQEVLRRVPGATLDAVTKADTTVHEGPGEDVLERVVKGLRYGPPDVPVREPGRLLPKVEEDEDDEELTTEEVAQNQRGPHLISVREFSEGKPGYSHVTLTYYEGDGSVVEEDEALVDDVDTLIGPDALEMFGRRSGDRNTVFIRNPRLNIDYEVVRENGSYGELTHMWEPTSRDRETRVHRMPREL